VAQQKVKLSKAKRSHPPDQPAGELLKNSQRLQLPFAIMQMRWHHSLTGDTG
jgi:hypothetical protein